MFTKLEAIQYVKDCLSYKEMGYDHKYSHIGRAHIAMLLTKIYDVDIFPMLP